MDRETRLDRIAALESKIHGSDGFVCNETARAKTLRDEADNLAERGHASRAQAKRTQAANITERIATNAANKADWIREKAALLRSL